MSAQSDSIEKVGCPIEGCEKQFKTERGAKCHVTRIHDDRPYTDESWLREKYLEEERSAEDVAEIAGCDGETIRRWTKRFGFARSKSESGKLRFEKKGAKGLNERSTHPNFFTRKTNGHEEVVCGVDKVIIKHHRLLATLLVDELEELDGKHVHHKSSIPWDNRPDNFEILDPGEHSSLHHNNSPTELMNR